MLLLGAIDLGLELGLEQRDDGQEILFARSSLVVDSAAAGLRGPVDRVWVDVRDLDGLARDCASAGRSASAARRSCTPTRSRRPTRRSPSANELRRAREIVAATSGPSRRAWRRRARRRDDRRARRRARELLSDEKRSVLHAE